MKLIKILHFLSEEEARGHQLRKKRLEYGQGFQILFLRLSKLCNGTWLKVGKWIAR